MLSLRPTRPRRGRIALRHDRWPLLVGALAAALLLVALAACGSGGSSSAQGAGGAGTADATTKPVSGGSLTYAVAQAEDTLNPAVSPETVTALIDRNIFDSLVVQTGPDSFGPWLATRWTISPDGKTYTFYLKHGVTFQDGTPFNAAAVKASLDYAVAPTTDSHYALFLLSAYKSSAVVNDYTIEIHLTVPYSPFLQALSTPYLGIQSPAELAKPTSEYEPVGTGPYRLVSWNKNVSVTLQAMLADHSPPSNAPHSGPAYINKLTFDFLLEDATRYGALTSGQVQAADDVPPINASSLKSTPGFYIQTAQAPGDNYNLYLNVKYGAFISLGVREAFLESVNVPALIKSVYFGQYQPASTPLSPTTAFYDSMAKVPAYNLAGAEKLLDEGGWSKVNAAGYRVNSRGQELTLVWPYLASLNHQERDILSDGIVADAKQAGINLERPAVTETQMINDAVAGNYSLFDYAFDRANADALRYAFVEPFSKGGGNQTQLQSAQLTGWLDGATQTPSAAAEEQDYTQAQQYVVDNAVVLPLYVEEDQVGASDKLHGITFDPDAYPLFYGAWLSS